jgi:hypothetical protein
LGCFLPAIELEVRQRTAVAVGVVAGDSPDWDLGMVGIALWEWMRSSAVSARGRTLISRLSRRDVEDEESQAQGFRTAVAFVLWFYPRIGSQHVEDAFRVTIR